MNYIANPYVMYPCLREPRYLFSLFSTTPTCSTTRGLCPSIGCPIILGVSLIVFLILFKNHIIKKFPNFVVIYGFLFVFCVSLFIAWSPLDFWSKLPKFMWVVEFTYRLVGLTMWSGAVLAAYGLPIYLMARGRNGWSY